MTPQQTAHASSQSSSQSSDPQAPAHRPLRSPDADRNHARASALVALALATTVAGGIAVVSLVNYDHTPDVVSLVHTDPTLKEFTRLSDREIGDAARSVCVSVTRGREPLRIADDLARSYRLQGSGGPAFVRTVVDAQCPSD